MALVDRSRGELKRGPHILLCQLRVLGCDAVRGSALGDQADDRGNRNARSGNARHAAHDPVIGHHALCCHIAQGSRAEP